MRMREDKMGRDTLRPVCDDACMRARSDTQVQAPEQYRSGGEIETDVCVRCLNGKHRLLTQQPQRTAHAARLTSSGKANLPIGAGRRTGAAWRAANRVLRCNGRCRRESSRYEPAHWPAAAAPCATPH